MNDAVLTHPHHPDLCGVAKFSQQLAEQLGVPCVRDLTHADRYTRPLVSVKGAEIDHLEAYSVWKGLSQVPFDLFAHDATAGIRELVPVAQRIFAANRVIARELQTIRPDVIAAWCPSLIQGDDSRAAYNVLTFGMAHKLDMAQYRRLKADLDAEHGDDYTVRVSTAVHEGSPWDATAEVADKLRAIFGSKLRVLGYLADDALARELHECDAVALYFSPAVRENNTTWHAAVASGKRIFTTVDADSPTSSHLYTWDRLKDLIHA